MTQETKPPVQPTGSQPLASPSNGRQDAAIDATPSGETVLPAPEGLPDLSRLSLGNENDVPHVQRLAQANGRAGRAGGDSTPGAQVHLSIYSQGGPVTVNVIHGTPGDSATVKHAPRIVRSAAGTMPPASPARVRLGVALPTAVNAPGTHVPAAAAPVENPAQAPLSPLLQGSGTPVPPSPSLESVSTTASPALPATPLPNVWEQGYEYIAPRDPTHNRWYVVTAGRRVGIWRAWIDMSDYVTGVSGNAHKLFNSRTEAENHYYGVKALGNVQIIMP